MNLNLKHELKKRKRKMMRTILLLIMLTLSSLEAACLPGNSLLIPVGVTSGGLSEIQFHKVIDRVAEIYAPVVQQQGARLIFNRKWEDATVNASAARDMSRGTDWFVSMYGGLARHPRMTEDAFAVVVCHELGHHLGGFPKKTQAFQVDRKWSSVEGQSDYFATLKCLKKIFAGQDNEAVMAVKTIPLLVKAECEKSFSNKEEQFICQRSAIAGLEVSRFIAELTESKIDIDFSTPDKKKVLMIEKDHNKPQCRLDTFYQGSLCDKDPDEALSKTDGNPGACTKKNGDSRGLRPRCWMTAL